MCYILQLLNCPYIEPVGTVSPKVNVIDQYNNFRGMVNHSLTILCPAQSYPVPVFRFAQKKIMI